MIRPAGFELKLSDSDVRPVLPREAKEGKTAAEIEFCTDVRPVADDRLRADGKFLGDFLGRLVQCDEAQNAALARRQQINPHPALRLVSERVRRFHKSVGERGTEKVIAYGHTLDSADDVQHHAVLENVPPHTNVDRFVENVLIVKHCENYDCGGEPLVSQFLCDIKSRHPGHSNVEYGHLRIVPTNQCQGHTSIRRLTENEQFRMLLYFLAKAFEDDWMIVGDDEGDMSVLCQHLSNKVRVSLSSQLNLGSEGFE